MENNRKKIKMPIKKENRHLYPKNWREIRDGVVAKANNKCELCDAENYKPHPVTGAKVVLTVHHCDYKPNNNKPYNLFALCQRCHNRLDKKWRAHTRERTKHKKDKK